MRMWEIREGRSEDKYPWKRGYGEMDSQGARGRGNMGHVKEDELKEAYECGYEDGYEEAMKEFEHKSYGRRRY